LRQLNELNVDLTKHQLVFSGVWTGKRFILAVSFNLRFAIHTAKYVCVVDVDTLLLLRILYSIVFLSLVLFLFLLFRCPPRLMLSPPSKQASQLETKIQRAVYSR